MIQCEERMHGLGKNRKSRTESYKKKVMMAWIHWLALRERDQFDK